MKPYYEHGGITIYHGDCRELLPELGRFDLLLTDPPYGIGADDQKRILSRSNTAAATDYGVQDWDSAAISDELMTLIRSRCTHQIIWGGNYYTLPPSSCWLIWDKENTGDFADGEMAWTNLDKAMRIKRHRWNGMIRKGNEARMHPTQKPLDVISWALRHAPADVQGVLDPFMGSGTTLRACKDAGKTCVGIELQEKYCEIAALRMGQECFAF